MSLDFTVGMTLLRTGALIVATISTGLMAGLFYAFAYSVMPGLGRTDDRTFVNAMQAIDKAIYNGWFFATFLGALVFTALAALLQIGSGRSGVLAWTVAALLLYIATLVITGGLSVPLNESLQAAGNSDRIADLAAVREKFEAAWVRWNIVRTVTSMAAFGCLTWALVLYGRATTGGEV